MIVNPNYTTSVVANPFAPRMMLSMEREWIAERISEVRTSQTAVAKALGLPQPRISEIIAGRREIKLSEVAPLAGALQMSVDEIIAALGIAKPTRPTIPLVGLVGAGGRIETIENVVDYVDMPPGATGPLEALRVEGTSMFPELHAGDVIYYAPKVDERPEALLNKLVALETADGELKVKYLRRGSEPGLFDLFSHAEPLATDVRVKRAAVVLFQDRRGRHF